MDFTVKNFLQLNINLNIAVRVEYISIYALKSLKKIAILCIILIKLIPNLQYSMVVMKLFWQIDPTINT